MYSDTGCWRLQRHSDFFPCRHIINARYPISSYSLKLEMNSSIRADAYVFVCVNVFIDTKRVGGHGEAKSCMCMQCYYLSILNHIFMD